MIVRSLIYCRSREKSSLMTGDGGGVDDLKRAFEILAEIRRQQIPIDIRIAEYPHSGILLDDQGFFEMEWPEGSYRKISALLDDVENNNYRCGFEMGAGCWEKFTRKFPHLVPRIRRLWEEGRIELSNGTWSLPYAESSPLAMQYWQFQYGLAAFKDIFGKAPELYQCQENSFPPQLPELLDAFGYRGAAHVTQNQGTVPLTGEKCFAYTAPSVISVSALGCSDETFFKGGINLFLDLPLTMVKHREKKTLDMFSMMDLSYIPLREAMIRISNNKEKVQNLIAQQRTNLADVNNLDLNSINNIIQNFENPSVSSKNPKNSSGGVKFSISDVWTGSAADYDKPSLHYIGSGEGSQVYGWGLYGSSSRNVAEWYAKNDAINKSTGVLLVDGKSFRSATRDNLPAQRALERLFYGYSDSIESLEKYYKDQIQSMEKLISENISIDPYQLRTSKESLQWIEDNKDKITFTPPKKIEGNRNL